MASLRQNPRAPNFLATPPRSSGAHHSDRARDRAPSQLVDYDLYSTHGREPDWDRSSRDHIHDPPLAAMALNPQLAWPSQVDIASPPCNDPEDEDSEIHDEAAPTDLSGRALFNDVIKTLKRHSGPKWTIPNKASPAGQLAKYARLIPRVHGPFLDMGEVVQKGMLWENGPPARWDRPEPSLTPKQKDRKAHELQCVKVFQWLKDNVPYFDELVPHLAGKGTEILMLGRFLDSHARQARATDINNIKKHIAEYFDPVMLPSGRTISPPTNKAQRTNKAFFGWESHWTAYQLLSHQAVEEFDANPEEFLNLLRTTTDILIDHHDNPTYLYAHGEYNPDKVDEALCQGEALLRALRCVYTSPSSAFEPAGKKAAGRGCISQIYKIDAVQPTMIAYIATLYRNVLTSSPKWEDKDGAFNGKLFYQKIVDLFTGPTIAEERWALDTLAWWNSRVYESPISGSSARVGRRPGHTTRSQDEILADQRHAAAQLVPPASDTPQALAQSDAFEPSASGTASAEA
ncbi:hypothetical protein C8Q80DRAFT_1276282 [Daedaleopsis nitida]|nr:hypothetical protein C8Q80DRAFT_1276282 [Daedaleopsis nitida]